MSTYDEIRSYFAGLFETNPCFDINLDELLEIAKSIACIRTGVDPYLLTRMAMLLDGSRDDLHVCFNTEAVAFGILESKFANDRIASKAHVQHFMVNHGFDEYDPETKEGHYDVRRDYKNNAIVKMSIVTERVHRHHDLEGASPYLYGRNANCDLHYVSQETFREALMRCERTRAIASCLNIFGQVIAIYTSCRDAAIAAAALDDSSSDSSDSSSECSIADANHRIELDALHIYYQAKIKDMETTIAELQAPRSRCTLM
jgi:hypothetical protein